MTKEERKMLLLKDICGRLLYDLILNIDNGKYREDSKVWPSLFTSYGLWDAKPYLRPMSSMTEEEKSELLFLLSEGRTNIELDSDGRLITRDGIELGFNYPFVCSQGSGLYVDWLDKKMFDYRGLIPMGIALPAPEGMYKNI